MTSTLTISRLTKRFQGVDALTDVSLTVAPGERVALLGHNGAGKSTMMKIILGLIPATSGEIIVCGAAPGSAAARAAVAYLPENAAFHPALTGEEQLRHYLRLRGENPAQAMGLLDKVGLGHAARRRIALRQPVQFRLDIDGDQGVRGHRLLHALLLHRLDTTGCHSSGKVQVNPSSAPRGR